MDYSSNVSVNASACSYNTLGNYNGTTRGGLGHPYVPDQTRTVSGSYIVPNYGAIGYNALTHGDAPGCSGYFPIGAAYGKNAGSCNTQYSTIKCTGCNGQCGNKLCIN